MSFCSSLMKRLFLLLAAGSMPLAGQQPAPGPSPAEQELLQRLFNPQNPPEDLQAALEAAAKAGFSGQILLEAQMLWGLRRGDTAMLTALLPDLERLAKTFDPRQSAGIRSVEEMGALLSYVKALAARQQGDEAAFKKHITEAFWLHPASGPLFAQAIEGMRREKKMANTRLDLDVVMTTSEGEATTLRDQLGDEKALLLDFWASWSAPSLALMPELRKKAEHLGKHGIVVAAMNTDNENAETLADKVRREKDMTLPWLVEPANRPYSAALEITALPAMVLVTPDGKVLFHGHPQNPDLWEALRKIDPAIQAQEP